MPKAASVGASCIALIVVFVVALAFGVFFWSWVLMLCLGGAGIDWSFWHTMFPAGIGAAFVMNACGSSLRAERS